MKIKNHYIIEKKTWATIIELNSFPKNNEIERLMQLIDFPIKICIQSINHNKKERITQLLQLAKQSIKDDKNYRRLHAKIKEKEAVLKAREYKEGYKAYIIIPATTKKPLNILEHRTQTIMSILTQAKQLKKKEIKELLDETDYEKEFLQEITTIKEKETNETDYYKNKLYHRGLIATAYPQEIKESPIKTILSHNLPVNISIIIKPASWNEISGEYEEYIYRLKLQQAEKELQGIIDDKINAKIEQAEKRKQEIILEKQRIHKIQTYITIHSTNNKTLEQLSEKVKRLFGKIKIKTAISTHQEATLTTKPTIQDYLNSSHNFLTSKAIATVINNE